MDSNILCDLLKQRLDSKYHRVAGENVVWLDEQGQPDENSFYNTPENRAIVEDVKANYETLKLSVIKAEKLTKIRAEANKVIEKTYPDWYQRNIGMGVFTEEQIPEVEACKTFIASVRQESNRCEALVNAATTQAQVDAVTPNWPVA